MTEVTQWDPRRYLTYADERGRPYLDLLARVPAMTPARVVDLGCGPGNQTALLARRWPDARVTGVDSSSQMIEPALAAAPAGVSFETGDVREWRSDVPVDVLVSNATFQWVPGHLDLLARLVDQVRPGGWFAFSVPGNFAEPSHALRREIASRPPYAEHSGGLPEPDAFGPEVYLERLLDLGCTVDAWETTYLHLLTGEDPVFTWISGTSARAVLQTLPADLLPGFEAELRERLREAYPPGPHGVLLPFRRVFAVAQAPA
ncbi:MAG: trans-aconitate 2-methyltransferase [Nocardioidaceae bacterium]